MAALIRTKYEADSGLIHPLKLTPDYAAAAGTEPAGDPNSRIKAHISKSNRQHGLRPRGVTLARTVGTAPDTFVKYTFLPLRSQADATSAAYNTGASVTVAGSTWEVVGYSPEDY